MARTAKPTPATKAKAPASKRLGRPPGSKNKIKATAKASAVPTRRSAAPQQEMAAPKRTAAVAVSRPSVVTKDELRAQVEKLERANATLRAKSREAGRAAKLAAARIEELEAQVTKLERSAIPKEAPARTKAARSKAVTPDPKPARSTRGRKPSGNQDPGDAVPPGVAVDEPEPMDAEAETALENLEEHLSEGETDANGKD